MEPMEGFYSPVSTSGSSTPVGVLLILVPPLRLLDGRYRI